MYNSKKQAAAYSKRNGSNNPERGDIIEEIMLPKDDTVCNDDCMKKLKEVEEEIKKLKENLAKMKKEEQLLTLKTAKEYMLEKLDSIVLVLLGRLPFFLGFLGLFFALKICCKVKDFVYWLIAASCLGLIFVAI